MARPKQSEVSHRVYRVSCMMSKAELKEFRALAKAYGFEHDSLYIRTVCLGHLNVDRRQLPRPKPKAGE